LLLGAVLATIASAAAQAAGLAGQEVRASQHLLVTDLTLIDTPVSTIIAPGAGLGPNFLSVIYTDRSITLVNNSTKRSYWEDFAFLFNGIKFSVSQPTFTDVTYNPRSAIKAAPISFDDFNILLDLRGERIDPGYSVILDINGGDPIGPGSAPEPGAWVLMMLGLAGVGAAVRGSPRSIASDCRA
jgi:hypothetical protein